MLAVIVMCREFADGNDCSSALRMPFNYVADLRRLPAAVPAYVIPADYFGNSVTMQVIKPPRLIPQAAHNTNTTNWTCLSGKRQQSECPQQQSHTPNASSMKESAAVPRPVQAEQQSRLQNALAAAACAIHQGTQAIRGDPLAGARGLAGMLGRVSMDYWQVMQASPEFNPMRDGASIMSSWRKSSIEQPDFGQGPAYVVAAKTLPLKHKMAFLTSGPGGDGVLCFTGFKAADFQHICRSQVLQQLAPGADFIKPKVS